MSTPMETEILTDDELAELTGYKARAFQRRWLDDRDWVYVETRGKRPLVGRQYMRMKLGIMPPSSNIASPTPTQTAWTPDFSRVR